MYSSFADDVTAGDEVLVQTTDGMVPSKVVKISESTMGGMLHDEHQMT